MQNLWKANRQWRYWAHMRRTSWLDRKVLSKKAGSPNPDQYISLVELCDLAEELGKSRYWMVKRTGGDAGVNPPEFPEFTIYLFGTRKYCRREAISTVREIAKLDK